MSTTVSSPLYVSNAQAAHERGTHNAARLIQAKLLKLIPFPNMDFDTDVPMLDAAPLLPSLVHSRLSSNASSVTPYDEYSPGSPTCNIFLLRQRRSIFTTNSMLGPLPTLSSSPTSFFATSIDDNAFDHSPLDNQIGLLQPKSSFVHHRYEFCLLPAFILFIGRPSVLAAPKFQNFESPAPPA